MAAETPEKAPEPKSSGIRTAGLVGWLAFFVGFILSIIAGFVSRDNGTIVLILFILGIIVSVLNITAKEVVTVLVAAIALIVIGAGTGPFSPLNDIIRGFGDALNGIVDYLARFMIPVAVISAIRAILAVGRPGE